MTRLAEQSITEFYSYPPVGDDDWRYTFETAQVRAMETQMLSRAALLDMANAPGFDQAADILAATEYALPQTSRNSAELESMLLGRRFAIRQLFSNLCIDRAVVALFRTRDDFANLRLALRRMLTQKPIGTDYSNEGNIPAVQYEQIFGENAARLEEMPKYFQQAVEQAVLAYYQKKDVRQIDNALDSFQARYNLNRACELGSLFLVGLFRIQIDLINIRTLLRLKFAESEQPKLFLEGGYIKLDRLESALTRGYDAIASLFFATPYSQVVEAGTSYLNSDRSFLKIERHCEQYLNGFLRTTGSITAGPQPIIAYLLMKENEIRTVRLILTAKKNSLDTKLILDRIS